MLWLLLARLYTQVVFWAARRGVRLPGLGRVCRKITLEHVIEVQGRRYFFHRPAADKYSLLLLGRFPEPETHLFLERLVRSMGSEPLSFVDVGAAVGEMVIEMARHANVGKVIAFEPLSDMAAACRLSAAVNEFRNVEVRQAAVSDREEAVVFAAGWRNGVSGIIEGTGGRETCSLVTTTLDRELPASLPAPILLIDVEGAELKVLAGARAFIERDRPLIVFEYNDVSRGRFSLAEVQNLLGPAYQLFRLRADGWLDRRFDETWNCVAVSADSIFHRRLSEWLVRQRPGTRRTGPAER